MMLFKEIFGDEDIKRSVNFLEGLKKFSKVIILVYWFVIRYVARFILAVQKDELQYF